MITLKLKTIQNYDVSEWQRRYTGMFHELYFNFELSRDPKFRKGLKEKYKVCDWTYQTCIVEVKSKLAKEETYTKKKQKQLDELLKITEFSSKRHKYKVIQKINQLKRTIGKPLVFGTKVALSQYTRLCNYEGRKGQKSRRIHKRFLKRLKKQYLEKRLLPFTSIGERLSRSNRKFEFDFQNKKILFKYDGVRGKMFDCVDGKRRQCKIMPIEFMCGDNQHKVLKNLQNFIGLIPISVRLCNKYVCIMFDEQEVSGFHFNKKGYYDERDEIPKDNEAIRKECYKKWVREQRDRMYNNKNKYRYISVDLNPEYIGFVVLERNISEENIQSNNAFRILKKQCICLSELNKHLGGTWSDKKNTKQTKKRNYEVCHAWKYIFNIARHYKVGNFIMEDLQLKEKVVNVDYRRNNRVNLTFWNRTLTENLITKYCNTIGLRLIAVKSCYSSFIGNIKHGYFDPVNAAIEIGRRGLTKFITGSSLFPPLERIDFDTMSRLGLDVHNKTISTWESALRLFVKSGLRYRRKLQECDFLESNLYSYKSNVVTYSFK